MLKHRENNFEKFRYFFCPQTKVKSISQLRLMHGKRRVQIKLFEFVQIIFVLAAKFPIQSNTLCAIPFWLIESNLLGA